jgi:hypothetical protein
MDPKLLYEAPFTDFDRTSVPPLLRATHTVPIVFANVPDPVGSGIVDSLARPGGMQFDYSLTAKWLELLKEVARGLKRVAVLRDATITPGIGQFAVIQSVAPSLGVEVSPIGVRDVPESPSRATSSGARKTSCASGRRSGGRRASGCVRCVPRCPSLNRLRPSSRPASPRCGRSPAFLVPTCFSSAAVGRTHYARADKKRPLKIPWSGGGVVEGCIALIRVRMA